MTPGNGCCCSCTSIAPTSSLFLLSIRGNLRRKLPGLAKARGASQQWVMLGSLPLLYPLPISLVPVLCHRWQIFTPVWRQKDVSEAVFISTELNCNPLLLSLSLSLAFSNLLAGELPKYMLPTSSSKHCLSPALVLTANQPALLTLASS